MANIINITDKFNNEKPSIQIGEKVYPVNNSISAMMAFEAAASEGVTGAMNALKGTIGEKAFKEIGVDDMAVGNLMVLLSAVLAAMSNVSYEEAAARFQGAIKF